MFAKIVRTARRAALVAGAAMLFLAGVNPVRAQASGDTSLPGRALDLLFDREDALGFELRLSQGYDDNIRLEPGDAKEGSWKSTVSPTIRVDIEGDQTLFQAAYTPTLIFYYPTDDQFDLNQHGNLNLRQNLTPRDIVGLEEIFISKQDPEDIRPVSAPAQRNADYIRNHLTLAYNRDLSPNYRAIIKYRNERDDYSKGSGLEGLNYWSNNGELFLRSRASPLFEVELFYRYRQTDYDTYDSDYDSHLGGVELRHKFSEEIEAKLEGGFEARFYTQDRKLNSPYAKLGIRAELYRNLRLELNYWYKLEDTFELAYLGYQGQGFNALAVYGLLPRVFLSLNALAEFAYFPAVLEQDGGKASAREHYLRGIMSLTYKVGSDMFIELGYDKTHNASDFAGASFRRNQVFLRLGLTL